MSQVTASIGLFNAEASLNSWLSNAIGDFELPAWMTAPKVVTNLSEAIASLPAFSVHHHSVNTYDRWQGRAVGDGKSGVQYVGIMEINCWVSRRSRNWLAQLRIMQDMVMTLFVRTREVAVLDYVTSQSDPVATGAIIRLEGINTVTTAPDPNPDVERARMLLTYSFIYRSP